MAIEKTSKGEKGTKARTRTENSGKEQNEKDTSLIRKKSRKGRKKNPFRKTGIIKAKEEIVNKFKIGDRFRI